MKRLGRRIRGTTALALAASLALADLSVTASAEAAPSSNLSELEWDERLTLYGGRYSHVYIDLVRLEAAHEGMSVPWQRGAAESLLGLPYFFLGVDPASGHYDPGHILVCIDVFHVRYEVPQGSAFFDLGSLVSDETAAEISRTLNAGLQVAAERGLDIRTDGSMPLTFATDASSDIMLAAQIKAWQLFARDNKSQPLPFIELGDFSVNKNVPIPNSPALETIVDYDLSPFFAELERLVDRYAIVPGFSSAPVRIGDSAVLSDPVALQGFTVEIDPATSTAGYADYVSVSAGTAGDITITKKKPIDKPLSLGFRKSFTHGLGGLAYAGTGVRAASDQIKTVLSNVYDESFVVDLAADNGGIEILKSDDRGTALDGAEFTVFHSDSARVATGAWDRPLIGLSGSNGRGRISFDDVPPGEYVLIETSSPDGYALDETPRIVTVRPGQTTAVLGGEPIVNVHLAPELGIQKSNGGSELAPGQLTTYELTVSNYADNADAVDVEIRDVLPESLIFVSADEGGRYDTASHAVAWTIDRIGRQPATVSITARVSDTVQPGTVIVNTASVDVDGLCPGNADPAACTATDRDVVPQLSLSKSDSTVVALPGHESTYALTVTNRSPMAVHNVVAVDSLPEQLRFVAADSHGHHDPAEEEVIWRLGTLAPQEQRTVHVTAWVEESVTPDEEIVNVASVTSSGICVDAAGSGDDSDPTNDGTTDANCSVRDVNRVPAVSVTKDDGRDAVFAGDTLEYRILAVNESAVAPAPDVVVVDQLPPHTELVDSSVPLAEGSTESSLRWSLGELAPGESREILVSVMVQDDAPGGSAIVNTAFITAAGICVDDPATNRDDCADSDEDTVLTLSSIVSLARPNAGGSLAQTGSTPGGLPALAVGAAFLLLLGACSLRVCRDRRRVS